LVARLADATDAKHFDFECVVDMTGLEIVVGVEILDLRRQLQGATVVPRRDTDGFRWSYDPEMDAFYLRVKDDSARIQKKARGVGVLDEHDCWWRLKWPCPPLRKRRSCSSNAVLAAPAPP
jgi:hypothetical protein